MCAQQPDLLLTGGSEHMISQPFTAEQLSNAQLVKGRAKARPPDARVLSTSHGPRVVRTLWYGPKQVSLSRQWAELEVKCKFGERTQLCLWLILDFCVLSAEQVSIG